jgi:hypothetical protein
MKLPGVIGGILSKQKEHKEVYLSLYLDVHTVAVSFWSLEADGRPKILASERAQNIQPSWEAKGDTIDRLIGALEEKTGITDVTKVILGLPSVYLADNGDIRREVRQEIKELTKILELTPVGFVSLSQAIMYKLKKDEGVPPSVILLAINDNTIAVSLYKVGVLAGVRDIEKKGNIALAVEEGLKSFTDLEVLPARILLFGSEASRLEETKSELLRHPWAPTVNFLHFPKIEIVTDGLIIDAVSLAGANELSNTVELETGDEAAVPVPEEPVEKTEGEEEGELQQEETLPEKKDAVEEDVGKAQAAIEEDFSTKEKKSEEPNVVMVNAESLGFKKDVDILEEEHQMEEAREMADEQIEGIEGGKGLLSVGLPRFDASALLRSVRRISNWFEGSPKSKFIPIVIIVVFLMACVVGYWLLPHAVVTVLEVPKIVDVSETITIDPTATVVDAEHKIIPGREREKSISGEKTVPVEGKKNVGDPASGTVTIYNKTLNSKSFQKGTVLVNGSLQFTLDSDVSIASASESIGSITYGKGDVDVTAAAIGPQSNIAAGSDFTFKSISSDVAAARNENAFTGGTSREITVVTRADYDAFVEAMSEELVGRAKEELASAVEGNDKLIDGTIETSVTEKVFGQELDQEATELQGKLTIAVSGIAYSESDIRAFLTTVASESVPSGYVINDEKTTVEVTNIQIKKDGKISAKATMNAVALPTIDAAAVRSALAGKTIKAAEEYLKNLSGVAGAEVVFSLSPTRGRLPINKNNITVSVSVQE